MLNHLAASGEHSAVGAQQLVLIFCPKLGGTLDRCWECVQAEQWSLWAVGL